MNIKGIDRILVSVENLEVSHRFYTEIMGFTSLSIKTIPSSVVSDLWRVAASQNTRIACLRNSQQSTIVELVEFAGVSRYSGRRNRKRYDIGLYDIAFHAKDLDRSVSKLTDLGYRFIGPPVEFKADWTDVTVKDAILRGPDDVFMPMIERLSEPKPQIEGDFGIMLDVAQFVDDMEAVLDFYHGALGLDVLFDEVLPEGLINPIIGIPNEVPIRLVFIKNPESNTPMLEFLQCEIESEPLYPQSLPPNTGLFSIAMDTDDLPALKATLTQKGYSVFGKTSERMTETETIRRSFTVPGPSGVLLEFVER